jgi:hypothetical protein
MKRILIVGLILIALSLSVFIFHISHKPEIKPIATDTGIYQGPVQEGYDEDLFRKTGRYEKIGVEE